MSFRIGDEVEWSSQAGGRTKVKRGKVVVIVPPDRTPRGLDGWREQYTTSHTDFGVLPRGHESYLVAVPTASGRGRPWLYWPLVSKLDRIGGSMPQAPTQDPQIDRGRVVLAQLKNRVVIILDRSGSMGTVRDDAVGFFNSQLREIKDKAQEMDTKIGLVLFDNIIEDVYWDQPIADARELQLQDYSPRGGTRLYDAVGQTISRLQQLPEAGDENTSFLVVIISDGMENSSTEYSADKISSLVKEVQGTNRWTLTYMGAGHDLSEVQGTLGIHAGNMASFTRSARGLQNAAIMNNASVGGYFGGRTRGLTSSVAMYSADGIGDADSFVEKGTSHTDTDTISKTESDPKDRTEKTEA